MIGPRPTSSSLGRRRRRVRLERFYRVKQCSVVIAVMFSGALLHLQAIDSDHDGMSDVWERIYGMDGSVADRDDDHDGLTNREESALGTDPRDPLSAFTLTLRAAGEPATFKLQIDTAFGKIYQLEASADLAHWSNVGPQIFGTGSSIEIPVNRAPFAASSFDRVRLIGDIDSDGDGLTAWEENELGTSDSNSDSDGDGMPDWWEFVHFLDPTIDDSTGDSDGDGVTNLDEYLGGTDPNDANSSSSLQLSPRNISLVINRGQAWNESLTVSSTGLIPSTFYLTPVGNAVGDPTYIDSDQPSGLAYVWEDIKETGTILSNVSDADDGFESFELMFLFPYFGKTFNTVFVSSNGFITFGQGSDQFDNYPLPSQDMPANEIAGFHADLNPQQSGDIYYRNEPDRTIVQFDNVARYDGNGAVDFQVILHRNGLIDLEYKSVPEIVDDVTVGIQNESRDVGLTIAYGQNYLHANMAVRITATSEWFSVSPSDGDLDPASSLPIDVSFHTAGLPSGIYEGELRLSRDAVSSILQSVPISLTVNAPPQVTIFSPIENFQCLENIALNVLADASDEDGNVTRVEFLADGQLIGEATASPFSCTWLYPSAGTHVLTAIATDDHNASATSTQRRVVMLANMDGDTLPDAWELEYFGNLDQTGDGDYDHDGLTNEQEYADGTDPTDYYNGSLPVIVIVAGDNQRGSSSTTLPVPAAVRITNQGGAPLGNAPVSFHVKTGDGAIASEEGSPVFSQETSTDASGIASIFLVAPATRGSTSVIAAEVRSGLARSSVDFIEKADAFLELTPETLSFAVNIPGTQSQTVLLRNTGPVALDYACETDALSYSVKDSSASDGPTYQWDDISTIGTLLPIVSQADDDYEAVDFPFNFPFFGAVHTKIYVSSNGFVTVGAGSASYTPGPLPGDEAVPGEIAAFHTDLDPSAGGRIFCLKTVDHAVIQFDNVPQNDGSGSVTFQIILDHTGEITFQYKSMVGTLNAATVGLQNLLQDQGVEVAFRKSFVANGLAVRFTRNNSWLQIVPATGQIDPGESIELTVTADSSHLSDGNYDGVVRTRSLGDESIQELPVVAVANAAPQVMLIAPAQTLGVVTGESVAVQAQAYDRRGQVAKVEFLEGSMLIGASLQEPFAIVWQPPNAGTFLLTARATDNLGATGISTPRLVHVETDSDGDGLGDEWEMATFGNLDQTGDGDFDGDGMSNLQEFHNGTAGNDYYEGNVPFPRFLARTRAASKSKTGLRPFLPSSPPRYFLKSEMAIELVGGNPESPVSGTIEVNINPDTGESQVTTAGNAPDPYYGLMEWDPSPTATQRFDQLTVLFGAEQNGGAYDDPPNLIDDFQAIAEERTTLSLEYTTDMLVGLARGALPPIPAFDAPFSLADDATFADFQFLSSDQRGVYISHSKYQFKWQPSPNLPELKRVTWLEIFYPFDDPRTPEVEDLTPITEVRHWEGTSTESPVYYLTPDRPGRYYIQMLPGELVVDGNRDGEMSTTNAEVHNKDFTSAERPYRFWINNDDDTLLSHDDQDHAIPAEVETVPPRQPDFENHAIISERNLEDFSRLWINLRGLTQEVQAGEIQVGLRWKNFGTDAPAINIYPSEDGEGSTKYLSDPSAAGRQTVGVFNTSIGDQSNRQTVDTAGDFRFKQDYWNGLSPQKPKKCLLFEGVHEGKGELVMVFFDRNGNELAEGGSVWIELKDIKKMYQRASATPDPLGPLPYRNFTGTFDESDIDYTPDVTPRFEQPSDEDPICFVFVHGWRLTYDDSITFSETMFKRLWWQGYKGRFAAFRWATQTSSFSYNTSEWLAWKYGRSLANYVENYVKHQLPNYTVSLAAHSMGNVVTASALKRGMSLDTYILMEAAIPAGCFNDSVNNYPPFLNAEQTNPTPDTGDDLGYRLYASGANVRNFVSFFNIDDYALATGTTSVFGWPFETNWEANQIDYKPNRFNEFDWTAGDYLYSIVQPIGHRVTLNWNPTLSGTYGSSRPVTEIHESMSFVARPRSQAAGSEINSATVFGSVLDLKTGCNFTPNVMDHSGQFERSIQFLGPFYNRLFRELQP